jgi:ribosomal-protein-alanine N-acetyltransferase
MNLQIETTRLLLRPFAESDAAAVMHFTDGEFETEKAVLEWIHWIKREDVISKPLIVFAIECKLTGDCIGRVYIHGKYELGGEVEIGYGIAKEHRNKGYATEAAKAAVWYAFEKAGQDVLCAIVKPENIASRRVIEKIGFMNCGTRIVPDDNGVNTYFNYFRLYHMDYLATPEWDPSEPFQAEKWAGILRAEKPL